MSEFSSWEVSTGELADLFGLSAQAITKLTDQGVIQRAGRGRYDIVSSVRSYVEHLETRILIRR